MSNTLNIESLVETAMVNWLLSNQSDLNIPSLDPLATTIVAGTETDDRAYPLIVVKSESSGVRMRGTSVHEIRCEVSLICKAPDVTEVEFHQLWGSLCGLIYWDELANRLRDEENLHVYDRSIKYEPHTQEFVDDRFKRSMSISFMACELTPSP